ncbi:MAG: ROK family protein [archaeon]
MAVLSMDVGGTNFRLAVIDKKKLLTIESVLTKEIKDPVKLIKNFLAKHTKYKIKKCGIGFAGPIIENKATLTNAGITLDKKILEKELKLKITFVNDFQAIGYGLKLLDKKDFFSLNKTDMKSKVNMVVGPGTGLGKAYIINEIVFASEGGHTILDIEDIHDYSLRDYLKSNLHREQIYHEDVVSGRGLIALYKHLAITSQLNRSQRAGKEIINHEYKTADMITKYAPKDPLCDLTLKEFTKYYARFVRGSALHLIPSHIYLCGGISPIIKEYLKKYFMREFVNHCMYSGLLKNMNVSIVMNTNVGLIGAGNIATWE